MDFALDLRLLDEGWLEFQRKGNLHNMVFARVFPFPIHLGYSIDLVKNQASKRRVPAVYATEKVLLPS